MSSTVPSPSNATRRKLLAWGGVGAIGGLACYLGWSRSAPVPYAVPQSPAAMPAVPPAVAGEPAAEQVPAAPSPVLFDREAFLPHVNSHFTMVSNEGRDSGTCTLVEVSPASRITSGKQAYTSFTLLFEADFLFLREGGLCTVQHEQMPEMQFFLSPVGRPGRKVLLEAAFTQAV